MTLHPSERIPVLVVRVGARACAVPLEHVGETLRPLPISPVAGMPAFVRGMSVVRGAPTPVVDLDVLLGSGADSATRRWVTLKLGARQVALVVDGVVGLRHLEPAQLGELPPILRDAAADFIEALGTRDAEILLVLRAARLVPDDLWLTLAAEARP